MTEAYATRDVDGENVFFIFIILVNLRLHTQSYNDVYIDKEEASKKENSNARHEREIFSAHDFQFSGLARIKSDEVTSMQAWQKRKRTGCRANFCVITFKKKH